MAKGRRVGTITTGITLILFGVLFIIRKIFPGIELSLIASIWPIILIFLGLEIIIAYIINKEEKISYDAGAILLMISLSFFSMGMAGVEFILNNYPKFRI